MPVVQPIGGHAVYLDARALLPHIAAARSTRARRSPSRCTASGGIRGCEIGTVMFGRRPDGTETPAAMDLVRLAIPRRTYTQSHIDYVIEVVRWVAARASALRGLRIVEQPPRCATSPRRFEPIGGDVTMRVG